jgi:hypothetical protein
MGAGVHQHPRGEAVNLVPKITPELISGLPKNGPTDPIEFYRRPLVGWLYRERINLGSSLLLARRFRRALEKPHD